MTEETSPTFSVNAHMRPGETAPQTLARIAITPAARHGHLQDTAARPLMGSMLPRATDLVEYLEGMADVVGDGDLRAVSDLMLAQAQSLDALFTQLTARALVNIGDYPDAFERYMRMALKSQAQSRSTLDALAKLHQPREQVVRHVHVYEGGQAVVAEEFHHHGGGSANAGSIGQPHAQVANARVAALPSANPIAEPLPGPGNEERAMPDARRQGQRRAARQS